MSRTATVARMDQVRAAYAELVGNMVEGYRKDLAEFGDSNTAFIVTARVFHRLYEEDTLSGWHLCSVLAEAITRLAHITRDDAELVGQ